MIFNRKSTETDNKKRDARLFCTTLFIVKQAAFPQNWFMALAPHGQICHKLPTACEFSVQTPEGESGLIIYYAGGQKACLTSEEVSGGKSGISLKFNAKPSIGEQKSRGKPYKIIYVTPNYYNPARRVYRVCFVLISQTNLNC